MSCPFCNISKDRIIKEFHYWLLIKDLYPVSKGHSLIIPKRHITSLEDITSVEFYELLTVIKNTLKFLAATFNTNDFNIGMNLGKYAGQTIEHIHIHIIPRYPGDVKDPKGGIRNVLKIQHL